MAIDIISAIKSAKVFSSLDDAALKKLINKFEKIHLLKNQILFHQGDVSDGLFLIVSGKLIAIVQIEGKEKKILGEVGHGQTIGELGALSHQVRDVTFQALENSTLLKLSSKSFNELCNEYPAVMLQTMNNLVARSRTLLKLITNNKPIHKHIAIFPANDNNSLQLFATHITEHLNSLPDAVVLIDNKEFQEKYATDAKLHQLIDGYEAQNKVVYYLLALDDTPLSKICLEKVDMIYVVGCGDAKPHIHTYTSKIIHNDEYTYKSKPELILLHVDNKDVPKQTSRWLKLADFGMHHHVRVSNEQDIQRLIRFLRGQAVGVVLGGGGVRSWAHIGALKALTEQGIPIDAIGGVSAGAIVGGFYAMYGTYEDRENQLHDLTAVTRKSISWRNLTWPAISIFDGEKYTLQQKKIFKHAQIENLWLPFFCVACNLSKSVTVVHKTGRLWKRVRSSTSVPGIFPPVVIRGQIHVDGGIINNLPVDLMRKMTSTIGTIVAVELIHKDIDETVYDFPPILPLKKAFLAKMHWAYKSYKFPGLVETFLKSLLMGSSVRQRENALSSDILVTPDLSQYDLLRITKKQSDELVEIGYKTAIKAIRKWRRKKQADSAKSGGKNGNGTT